MERYSKNREVILECLKSTTSHPTAEWIYQQLKPDYPKLSLGTVYRNLSQLKEAGIILSMGTVAGEEHFDGNAMSHPHAVCKQCGCIKDLSEMPAMETICKDVELETLFQITELQFLGLCGDCAKKEA